MGNIYAGASKVFAWLGPFSPGSDEAFQAVRQQQQRCMTNAALTMVKSIAERPFWRRVWIIQEMAKAREVDFMIGDSSMAWDEVAALFAELTSRGLIPESQVYLFDCLADFCKMEENGRAPQLARALVQSKGCLASNPRDKVYALLGLVSDGARKVPLPNYSQHVDEVLYQIVKRILGDRGQFWTVLLARPSGDHADADRSSWYPNLLDIAEDLPPWIMESISEAIMMRDIGISMTRDTLTAPLRIHVPVKMVFGTHTEDPDALPLSGIKAQMISDRKMLAAIFHALTWDALKPCPDPISWTWSGLKSLNPPIQSTHWLRLDRTLSRLLERSDIPGFGRVTQSLLVMITFARLCLGKYTNQPTDKIRKWMFRNGRLRLGVHTLQEIMFKCESNRDKLWRSDLE